MSFTYIPQREKWRTAMLLSWKKGDLRRFGESAGCRRARPSARAAYSFQPRRGSHRHIEHHF